MGKKERKRGTLKDKMFIGLLLTMAPVLIVVTVIFLQTRHVLQEEYIETTRHDLQEISGDIDNKLAEIAYISSVYAENKVINEYAEKDYETLGDIAKKSDIIRIHRELFDTTDRLGRWNEISAIYTNEGMLLNLLDPNNDTAEVRDRLDEMEVNAPDALMRLIWHPVQENFLRSTLPEDVHERMTVIGSRRVYSWEKARYEYAQIFALDEKEIYDLYKDKAEQFQGEIYILDENGNLISTSDTKSLEAGTVPEQVVQIYAEERENDKSSRMDVRDGQIILLESKTTGWATVLTAPYDEITRGVESLYMKFFLLLIVCIAISGVLIAWLYKSFMVPIGILNHSMREVYDGNLNAYVPIKEDARKNETNEMMLHYNSMLHQINTHIIEKLELDRTKKELELEVLMSQINPHFLYNTLETIVWKSNEARRPDIGRLAASLGRMYRLSISGGQTIVPIQHEIEHLMAYVKIQKNRYGDAVEFDLRSNSEEIRELYCLKILLQPVVENAFLYGMTDVEHPVKIRVVIRVSENEVAFRVMDNGCGMGRNRVEQIRAQIRDGRKEQENREVNRRSTGIGLHSVQMRIRLYFGMENAVTISSRKGRGTCVTVRIPRITKENAEHLKEEI